MDDWDAEQRRKLEKLIALEEQLGEIAQNDQHMRWLWASVRRLAAWLTIVVGAFILLWENFKAFFVRVFGI